MVDIKGPEVPMKKKTGKGEQKISKSQAEISEWQNDIKSRPNVESASLGGLEEKTEEMQDTKKDSMLREVTSSSSPGQDFVTVAILNVMTLHVV